jgi:hypothetical protein
MPCDRAPCGPASLTAWPATIIWPESGCTTPEAILAKVDFPAPFAPIERDDLAAIDREVNLANHPGGSISLANSGQMQGGAAVIGGDVRHIDVAPYGSSFGLRLGICIRGLSGTNHWFELIGVGFEILY